MITPLFFFIFILKFSMKQDVKLYISDRLVDFSNELSMPFTYQLKDLNNPSIVKNPFTKTIDIIGTPNNNKIFGEIYNFDREQMYDATKLVGAYFNPSVRTPFKIFRNGDNIESGYMQLNDITIKNGDIHYNITLYGGIGNFFYSLMYNEDGESLTLGDLVYGVTNEETGLPFENPDEEMNFTINKEFVYECFNTVGEDNWGLLTDYITFVPSYNGLPENFDSDKVLINTHNNSYWSGTTSKTENSVKYTPYNSYVLAELPRKYNEWEMLDLRSYLQRPAIKMSKIIDACSNPINNGGYTVELDPDFFNSNNPYYNDAWVALPLLSNQEKEKNNVHTSEGELYNDDLNIGYINGKRLGENQDSVIPLTYFSVTGDTIQYKNTPVGTMMNIEIDYSIDVDVVAESEVLYLNKYISRIHNTPLVTRVFLNFDLIVYDDKNNVIAEVNNIFLTHKEYYSQIKCIRGRFVKTDGNKYRFLTFDDDESSFKIKLENIPFTTNLRFDLKFKYDNSMTTYFEIGTLYDLSNAVYVDGIFTPVLNSVVFTSDETDNTVGTNSLVVKKQLLKTEKSPADYLLGYTKLFNLFYTVDENTKTIKIQTMSNYFNGNVLDWSNKIDYSKEIKIKPLMFDKKFYCMKQDGESYYSKKYKNEYTVEYGQKRINTNYNFNNDTQQLFEGNVYQNAVSVIDTSPYYHTFFDKNEKLLAPFNNTNYTYQLFNKSTGGITSLEVDYTTPSIKGGWSWNRNNGYDSFAKTCFYNLENDEKSLSDISSVLLFYNGRVQPEDFDGNRIRYKLSDDVFEMYELNNKTPCWLFSDYDYTANLQIITYDCSTLPQFLRYKIVGNQVQASWDFGKPKEIYIPDITYNEGLTIYDRYWNSYYSDQLNLNTKEVTCYVNLNDVVVNGNLLRNFYYFNGCYWILNKINNHNINDYNTTQCTFIRVNNLSNYKNNIGEEEVETSMESVNEGV